MTAEDVSGAGRGKRSVSEDGSAGGERGWLELGGACPWLAAVALPGHLTKVVIRCRAGIAVPFLISENGFVLLT